MWLETGLEALPYMQVGEIYVIRAYCRLPTHCWSLQQKQLIRKTNPTPTKYRSQTFAHGRKLWWLGDVLSGCQIQVVLRCLQPHEPVSYCVSKAFNLYDKAQKKVVSKLDTRTWISLLFEWSRVFPFPHCCSFKQRFNFLSLILQGSRCFLCFLWNVALKICESWSPRAFPTFDRCVPPIILFS